MNGGEYNMHVEGLGIAIAGVLLFANARKVAGMRRFFSGREYKHERSYYLQLRCIFSPALVLLGIAMLLEWVRF